MSQELYFYLTQAIRSKAIGWMCGIAAVGLATTVPSLKIEEAKTAALIGGLGLSLAATASFRTQEESDSALNDYRINAGLQRQRNLFQPIANTEKETEVSVDWFDFSTIGNDRDKFPNVVIMGEPGSGKTSLAEYLGVVLKANKRYAIHPHAKPTDFGGFNKVWGGGRNYGSPDDEALTWQEITSGNVRPTISQVLQSLLVLMNERYEKYYNGETTFDAVDVYIDELPSIVSNLGKKFIASILPQLLMECRKVGIRLWLLVQGAQVRMLGLEGMSDLREGITFIRLGRLAVKHPKDKAQREFLQSMRRPCLVDDNPAKLPGFTEMSSAIKAFVRNQKQLTPATQVETKVLETEAVSESSEPNTEETLLDRANDCIDRKDFSKLPTIVSDSGDDADVMCWIGKRLVGECGMSMSNVIEKGWGMKGRRFDEARALYREFGLDKVTKAEVV